MEPSSSNESVSTSSGRPLLPSVDDCVALSRPSLILESYEVVMLASYAVAMKEYLIMAAERVLPRAAQYHSSFKSHQKFLTREPTPSSCDSVFCAPALFEQQKKRGLQNTNQFPLSCFFFA